MRGRGNLHWFMPALLQRLILFSSRTCVDGYTVSLLLRTLAWKCMTAWGAPSALLWPQALCPLSGSVSFVSFSFLEYMPDRSGRVVLLDQLRDGLGLRRLGVERDAVPGPRPGYPPA